MKYEIHNFTSKLRNLMAEKNLTQLALAKETNIPQSTINKICNGKTDPTSGQLCKIANYLEVSLDYLLSEVPEPIQIAGITYGQALEAISKLCLNGSIWVSQDVFFSINNRYEALNTVSTISVRDEILKKILGELYNASKLDGQTFQYWVQRKVDEYNDLPVVMWTAKAEDVFKEMNGNHALEDDLTRFLMQFVEQLDSKNRED